MPVICAVYGCGNNNDRDRDKNFFRIPKIRKDNDPSKRQEKFTTARRKQWLLNISRADLDEDKAKYTRVCRDHFISGEFSLF